MGRKGFLKALWESTEKKGARPIDDWDVEDEASFEVKNPKNSQLLASRLELLETLFSNMLNFLTKADFLVGEELCLSLKELNSKVVAEKAKIISRLEIKNLKSLCQAQKLNK